MFQGAHAPFVDWPIYLEHMPTGSNPACSSFTYLKFGASGENRTHDLLFTRQLHYLYATLAFSASIMSCSITASFTLSDVPVYEI